MAAFAIANPLLARLICPNRFALAGTPGDGLGEGAGLGDGDGLGEGVGLGVGPGAPPDPGEIEFETSGALPPSFAHDKVVHIETTKKRRPTSVNFMII